MPDYASYLKKIAALPDTRRFAVISLMVQPIK